MLDTKLTEQLKAHLANITEPIELVASLDESPKSDELRRLLEQDVDGRQAGRAPPRAARAQTAHETKRARLRHPNVSAQRFFQ